MGELLSNVFAWVFILIVAVMAIVIVCMVPFKSLVMIGIVSYLAALANK